MLVVDLWLLKPIFFPLVITDCNCMPMTGLLVDLFFLVHVFSICFS